MRIIKRTKEIIREFRQDMGGQFAVITALIGVPLLLICAAAIDINKAGSRNEGLRTAIDAAALAAVIPDNMTDDERFAYARTVFDENYFGRESISLEVSGNR